jgi:hypothetical protein
MKKCSIALLLLSLCLSPLAAACTPGHLGGNVIAFLRDGHLWTIDPNGANAFEVAAQSSAIIGYNWSPNHEMLAFRALNPDFAQTTAAQSLRRQPITGQISDAPTSQNIIGVDGGQPMTIAFSQSNASYSNTFWNTNSTRLLYRQSSTTTPDTGDPLSSLWFVSQNDQPGGTALRELPRTSSLPSISYDATNYLILGISPQGVFSTSIAGTDKKLLTTSFPLHQTLPPTLERLLWRPQHQNESFLYATINLQTTLAPPYTPSIILILQTLTGQTTPLATCTCTQFAWSPDGSSILYTTGIEYTIENVANKSLFHVQSEEGSVPYWSPDGQFLVLDGKHTLQLIAIQQQRAQVLLRDTQGANTSPAQKDSLSTDTLLQPVPNNIWSPDSRHFLFLTGQRLFWQEQQLRNGKGLYTVTIDDHGQLQGSPTLVDTGDDTQAGWTYEDPNTSFLF